jgi:dTDP-4-dehydrorhamnose reductase
MIWIIGGNGMLGKHFEFVLQTNKIPYIATDKEVDITDIENLQNFIKDKKIDWMINCSAYTAVDLAENEKEKAYAVNATGVENITTIAKQLDIPLIHFSTDYIFDGEKQTDYTEEDIPNPQTIYGKSKLAGEIVVLKYNKHFLLRLSWLYGPAGDNFVFKMIRQFVDKKHIRIVNDQFGSPTYTGEVVSAVLNIILTNSDKYGLYHFSGRGGKISWYEYCMMIHKFFKPQKLICFEQVKSDYFKTAAKRPKNSYMDCSKFEKTFNIQINNWWDTLETFIEELKK